MPLLNSLGSMFTGALCQGLLWSVMAIGVYISFRILDFADMTAQGSFPLGASVAAALVVAGVNPVLATVVAVLSGVLAGMITGFLNTVFKIPPLLAGILTMTGLYSINLRVMGKAQVPLLKETTVLTYFQNLGLSSKGAGIAVGALCVAIVIAVLWWFFNTELGYAVRATGDNPHMIRALGVSTNRMTVLGLALGNALVAFSGALVCQYQQYSNATMGNGTIVIGLAAVIIGEVFFRDKNNVRALIAVVLGSIIYRIVVALVYLFGAEPNDMSLISAIILSLLLALPVGREVLGKFVSRRQIRGDGHA